MVHRMRLLPQLPKFALCLQCGDRGFPETLVACAKCRLYAVHRYCLHKLPPNFRDPVTWFCEDCRPGDYVLQSEKRLVLVPYTGDQSMKMQAPKSEETTGDRSENRLALAPYAGDRPEKRLALVPEKMQALIRKETTVDHWPEKMLVPKLEETAGDQSEKMLPLKREETTGDKSKNRLALAPYTGNSREKMLVPKREEKASDRFKKRLAGDRSEKMLAPKGEETTGDKSGKMLAPTREDTTGERSEKRLAVEPYTGDQSAASRLLDDAVGRGKILFKEETAANDNDVILPEQKAVTQETTDDCSGKKLLAEQQEKIALVPAASSPPDDAVWRGGKRLTREMITNDNDALPEKKTVIQETDGNDKKVLPSRKTVTQETADDRSNKKPTPERKDTTDEKSSKKLPLVPRRNVLPSRKMITQQTTDDKSNKKPTPERDDTTDDKSGKKLPLVPRRNVLPSRKTITQQTTDDRSNKKPTPERDDTTDDKSGKKLLLVPRRNVLPSRKTVTDDRSNKMPTPEREDTTDGRSGKKLPLVPRPTAASLPVVDAVLRSGKRCTQETITKYKDDISNKKLPLEPRATAASLSSTGHRIDAVRIGRKRLRPETTTHDNNVLLPPQKAVTRETTDDRSNKKPTLQREETMGGRSEKILALVPQATTACRPLEDAVWRGSLNIVNKGPGGALIGGFHLFLSTTACDRVREEAKALAPAWSIQLEMVPRRGLWPESFGKLGPARSEVGLFLLANAGEGDGEGLVREMVRQDLAMRGAAWRTEEAELLVFTSAVLPADLWMIDGRFYLWGVFRGRKATSSCGLHPRNGHDDRIGIPFPLQ